MPKHMTVATVIEKNRISSNTPFLELLEIEILDSAGDHVEWVRLAKNSEDVEFEENVFYRGNFEVKTDSRMGEEPTISVSAKDPLGVISSRLEQYDGGVGFPVRYIIVNADRLDQPAEIEEDFVILSASAPPGFAVQIELGAESPFRLRYPLTIQEPDSCRFKYKGTRCGYSGELATCDFSHTGPNGCRFHDNESNFGGFPSLKNLST